MRTWVARRLILPVAAVVAATLVTGAAGPADGAATRGEGGPVVTHPVYHPFDYPAGEVCAFPAHVEFPVSDLTERTWYDHEGRPLFGTDTGPLIMRATNVATGRTVERDISGSGTLIYPTHDANDYILSGSDWSAGFHTGDEPASARHHWYISRGYMSVRVTTVNGHTTRQLLVLRGPYEDMCATLS